MVEGGKGGEGREGVVGRQESGPRIAGGIRKKTKPQPQRRTGAETWLTAHANTLGRGGIEEKWWRRCLAGGGHPNALPFPPLLRTHGGPGKGSVIAGEAANTGRDVGHREQFFHG